MPRACAIADAVDGLAAIVPQPLILRRERPRLPSAGIDEEAWQSRGGFHQTQGLSPKRHPRSILLSDNDLFGKPVSALR